MNSNKYKNGLNPLSNATFLREVRKTREVYYTNYKVNVEPRRTQYQNQAKNEIVEHAVKYICKTLSDPKDLIEDNFFPKSYNELKTLQTIINGLKQEYHTLSADQSLDNLITNSELSDVDKQTATNFINGLKVNGKNMSEISAVKLLDILDNNLTEYIGIVDDLVDPKNEEKNMTKGSTRLLTITANVGLLMIGVLFLSAAVPYIFVKAISSLSSDTTEEFAKEVETMHTTWLEPIVKDFEKLLDPLEQETRFKDFLDQKIINLSTILTDSNKTILNESANISPNSQRR